MKKFLTVILVVLLLAAEAFVLIYSGPDSYHFPERVKSSFHALVTAYKEKREAERKTESVPESVVESKTEQASAEISHSDSGSTPSDESVPDSRERVNVIVSTTEADLYMAVRDSKSGMIDDVFTLRVTYPNGKKYTFKTNDLGAVYLSDLNAGNYTVSLADKEGYQTPDPQVIAVKGGVARKKIDHISKLLDIKITDEYTAKELTGKKDSAGDQSDVGDITSHYPVPDFDHKDDPLPTGSTKLNDGIYSYVIGPHGYLMLADGKTESDVKPYLDAGLLVYGLRAVYTLAGYGEETSEPLYDISYEHVSLFDGEGNPNRTYDVSKLYIPPEELKGWVTVDGKTYYYDDNGNKVTGYTKINGVHYYFDSNGVKASSLGVDVSEWQTVVSWKKAKQAGIDFAIVRIGGRGYGSGSIYNDDRAISYLKSAKAAGLKIGVYFFSAAINETEAVEEASWTLEILNGMKLDFPIFIDVEHSGDYPNGRADRLNKNQHTAVVKAFCETIESGGYDAGVYASSSYYTGEMKYSSVQNYYIWLANYTTNYAMTTFPYAYKMWQFTPKAKIDGINGTVDLNVIF